ncbi:MAG: hypothetical protein Kow00121_23910 [Elainellaceae cyanobacterium]
MNVSKTPDPWIGRLIDDRQRYRLENRLGGGGMGNVFLAIDTLLGQPVALKILKEKLAGGELQKRFEREIALSVALRNAHIVRISDYGVTSEGYPFYVMEYLQGQTLRQLLKQEQRLSVERTINIVAQICAGLHLAHQGVELSQFEKLVNGRFKVIHRDLKPDNIFLVPTALGEFVKVLDFGIAKICSDRAEHTNATTAFLGTYRYAAPEQLEVEKDLDERADIYSLGIILYEMLSGTDPFGLGSKAAQISGVTWAVAHCSKPVIPLRQQFGCGHLSAQLEAVVMRCLEKSPEQRFQTADQLLIALQAAVSGMDDRPPTYLDVIEQSSTASTVDSSDSSLPTVVYSGVQTLQEPLTAVTPVYKSVFSTVASESGAISRSSNPFRTFRKPLFWVIGAGVATATTLGLGIYYSRSSSLPIVQSKLSAPQRSEAVLQSASPEGSVAISKVSDSSVASLPGHLDTIWSVAISIDGKTIASGSFDQTIKIWDFPARKLLRTLSVHTDAIRSVVISSDGQVVASGSSDKTIKLWNLQTGELLQAFSGHSGPVWSVDISSDGQILVSGSYDGTIKVWDLTTGALLRTLPEHYDSVWSVDISPDGQTLVSGSYDGTVKAWNLQTGQVLRTFSKHSEPVRSVAISPSGTTLASASWDKTVKVWDLQTGQLLHTLSGHSDRVVSVAISPDNQTLASSSLDRTIKIWDLETGALLHTLSGHTDWVISTVFNPDGKTLISGSKDQTIKIWQW